MISYSRARAPLRCPYELDGALIPRLNNIRDLGVEMVPELTFRNHIVTVCSKAFKSLGFILRNCKELNNISSLRILYNALVRSYLEAIIWNPHKVKYSLMVEKLQNKFTRFLFIIKNMGCTRCTHLCILACSSLAWSSMYA